MSRPSTARLQVEEAVDLTTTYALIAMGCVLFVLLCSLGTYISRKTYVRYQNLKRVQRRALAMRVERVRKAVHQAR